MAWRTVGRPAAPCRFRPSGRIYRFEISGYEGCVAPLAGAWIETHRLSWHRDGIARSAPLALAWLLAQAGHVVPIPGTRSSARLHENIGALTLGLPPKALAVLSEIWKPGLTAGARYSAEGMKGIDS